MNGPLTGPLTGPAIAQMLLVFGLLLASIRPLGGYLGRVFAGEPTLLSPLLRPVEAVLYRLAGVRPAEEQPWHRYAMAFLAYHLPGLLLLYALLRCQSVLPLNPAGQGPVAPDLAMNTAISFATNTSWQSYGGETTLSDLAQMAGIAVQSFLSGAAGLAVAAALMRGFARRGGEGAGSGGASSGAPGSGGGAGEGIGNFWADITRATLYVLLPIAVVAALFLAWEGVPQTLAGPLGVATLEGAHQTIASGPVASQVAIKLLSGDGGGFFNAQSAHPFENPTALTNLLGILLMPLLGAALTNSFGRMVGDERQGWALLAAMAALLLVGAVLLHVAEAAPNPMLSAAASGEHATLDQSLGNLEGKEIRFGAAGSALFSEFGTATSSGAVNAMQDSYLPLGGLVLLANMMLDEVIIGGPGSGLFGMLLFAVVAVFMGGLMIGRTPEYVGNKIEAREIKMAMLAILAVPAALLFLTALAVVVPAGLAGLGNAGPHGFSEVLYAYTSAANTNGSSMAGLSTNTPFYNFSLAFAMVAGRFLVAVPVIALAGSLAPKRRAPPSLGTLPTTGPIWVGLLLGVIVIVGGMTYFPALALGPVVEQVAMTQGTTF